MNLSILLQDLFLKQISGPININILDIHIDSRKIKKDNLFIALKGHTVDGHHFIEKAIENGAIAIVSEKNISLPSHVTLIQVPDSRKAMSILANRFFDFPSDKLNVIGVTGTNGKTTSTNLIEQVLSFSGYSTGLIGTIHTKYKDIVINSVNTTPESLDLIRTLSNMVDADVTHVTMEVSSHALVEGRTKGVDFKSAIFTNLTQDHLDFHSSMEEYKKAKSLLFSQLGNSYGRGKKFAILNADDPTSADYKMVTSAEVITYGIDHTADFQAKNIKLSPKGTSFTLISPFGEESFQLQLVGKFNIYNALCAIITALIEGVSLSDIKQSLEAIKGVEGRFESIYEGQDFSVIVDFAHTPDSLENVLKTIQGFKKGNVYTIIGCGGNRDKGKRPIMASLAEKYSDFVVLTSDNPRKEDPLEILNDMEEGIKGTSYIKKVDRKEAIEYVIRKAQKNDCILVAGKGHETYQIIGDTKHHFSDKEEIKRLLSK